MVSVIATIVLLLALASIILGQQQATHNAIVNCFDGVATAGSQSVEEFEVEGSGEDKMADDDDYKVCTVDVCMQDSKKHHNRLFIIEKNYGYKCVADGEAFKMRLTTCFATISDTHYQAFSDAALNNLRSLAENKGPDDETEVWKICQYLITKPNEWAAYQKVKAEEGSLASLLSADIRSVYTVKATADKSDSNKVGDLTFKAIGSTTQYNLADIPDPIKLFDVANTCSVDVGKSGTGIDGGSHFVDGTAVYTCKDVQRPVLLGCLTVMPVVAAGQSTLSKAQLTYITIPTVEQLKRVYFGIAFTSATNRPLDDIGKMSVKNLCAAISDEIKNNKNLFDKQSPYTPKPKTPVKVRAVLAWFAPKFYVN